MATNTLPRAGTLNAFIRSLRPRQWTKNLLVFSAPLFANTFDLHSLLITSAAFVAFCALSSAIYLINDVLDAEQDRHHPVKRFRPLAAGEVSVAQLLAGAVVLVSLALGSAALIQPKLLWFFFSYITLQVLYNLKFKELVILDIMTLAAGFVLRAVAGAVAVSVAVSPWFVSSIGLISLFIAVEKRKSELRRMEEKAGNTRKALNVYSLDYLDKLGNTAAASSLITYGLWTFQASKTQWMMLTIPLVAYALFRYQYLVWDSHRGESPEDLLLSDHPLFLAIALWVLACFLILALDR